MLSHRDGKMIVVCDGCHRPIDTARVRTECGLVAVSGVNGVRTLESLGLKIKTVGEQRFAHFHTVGCMDLWHDHAPTDTTERQAA